MSDSPFELALKMQPRLMAMLVSVCGSKQKADEAWSDVVLERIERVCATYNPEKGPVEPYVLMTMRLYAGKWVKRSARFIGQETRVPRSDSQLGDFRADVRSSPALASHLEEMLAKLEPFDAWIIRAYVIDGYTFKEISTVAQCSKSTVRIKYEQALRRAWPILRPHLEESDDDR